MYNYLDHCYEEEEQFQEDDDLCCYEYGSNCSECHCQAYFEQMEAERTLHYKVTSKFNSLKWAISEKWDALKNKVRHFFLSDVPKDNEFPF